ncbi:hypothetical protein, partial [Blautia producta]|uniref:hypothetical protein n=1 Tax=Blautia producta TaxID=33035 RepID=UPI0031B5BCF9
SQLLNSSAMASSLSNWGRWISAALHYTSLTVSPAPAPSIPFLFFFGPQVFLIFNIFSNIRMSGNCFWQAVRHSLWDIWLFTTVWLSCSFVTFRQGKTGMAGEAGVLLWQTLRQ